MPEAAVSDGGPVSRSTDLDVNPVRGRHIARLCGGSRANRDCRLGSLSAALLCARRPDKATVDAAIGARRLLDKAFILKHAKHLGDLVLTNVAMRVLTAAELEREAHLVPFPEELADLAQLVLQVADIRSGMELDLLHLRGLLGLALLLGLDRLLVAELSVVHDLAHGRLCVWSDFNQIKTLAFRHALCLVCRHNAEHLTVCVKNAHRRNADLVVYASERSDNTPLFAVVYSAFAFSCRRKRGKL